MELYTLWPHVGSGTASDPYRISWAPITLQGQARLLLNNFTCFNSTTGTMDGASNELVIEALRLNDNYENLGWVGSHHLVKIDPAPFFVEQCSRHLAGLAFFALSEQDLLKQANFMTAVIRNRLKPQYPVVGSANLIDAGVEVIDSVFNDSLDVWDYYNRVIDPAQGTPGLFDGLIKDGELDINRVRLLDVPDQLNQPVRTADLGWLLVLSQEVKSTLGG